MAEPAAFTFARLPDDDLAAVISELERTAADKPEDAEIADALFHARRIQNKRRLAADDPR